MRRSLLLLLLPAFLAAEDRPLPAGFDARRSVSSTHFHLYHEAAFVPAGLLGTLEGLRAKLLLDLQDFAPWAKDEAFQVFVFANADSYVAKTGIPAWSAAHVNLQTRQIFCHESTDLQRTLAHEMAHLFFTSYFEEKQAQPPVWLNEGVAVLMEWDYGLEGQSAGVQDFLKREEPMPLDVLFSSPYQHNGDVSRGGVSLYYIQAYSLAKFLMRRFSRAQFVTFCDALRSGAEMDAALKSGYGLQLSNVQTLDSLWRRSLE